MFRTRQAPSPTGYLHFGTARTMLFTQLIARKNNGIWFLRLEDTDRNRLQKDAVGSLLESMYKLGLTPDEGINYTDGNIDSYYNIHTKGNYGPYIQSKRLSLYHKYAQQLIDKNLCYWSYITPEDKEELVNIKHITKKPINYFQANIQKLNNLPLTQSDGVINEEISQKLYLNLQDALKLDSKPDLKFKILEELTLETDDVLLGKSKFDLSLEEDFTCIKSDGFPTYHFAHPVDDYLMESTLVIRAQEWVSSLPKHLQIFKALDFKIPQYLHLPFILGETGNKKMSKRDGNVNMEDYLKNGYLPEAIINYLSFLGWNPGNDTELYLENSDFDLDTNFSIEENRKNRIKKLYNNILKDFKIEKIQKSPARFSLEKLNWYNKEYLKKMSPKEFIDMRNPYIEFKLTTESSVLDQYRIEKLSDVLDSSNNLNSHNIDDIELVKWKKISLEESINNLKIIKEEIVKLLEKYKELKTELSNLQSTNAFHTKFNELYQLIEIDIKAWLNSNNYDVGSYLWPLRTTLSGKIKSASPFEIIALLDEKEIIKRIDYVINKNS
jgi:nondiscriminating glutamyl-tRNA synthetase